MIKLSVHDAPRELRGAVLAMKKADADIRRGVSQDMRATLNGPWKQAVNQHLTGAGRMEAAMLTPGVRIAPGNPPVLVAASSRRKVGHSLVPDANAAGYEFGASDAVRNTISSRGKVYKRHVMRHLPARTRKGRVVYPAAAKFLPRVAAYWVQSIVKAFMDAAEGKD